MDKKTILGIVVVAVLFLGFAYVNTKQQEKYQQEMAAWQAYQDSVAAASRPAVPAADSAAGGVAESVVAASGETAASEAEADLAQTVRQRRIAAMGEYLTAAQEAEPEEFTVENEVMTVRFSTRGGQITGVTLKDYTKYAPCGQRDQLIEPDGPCERPVRHVVLCEERPEQRQGQYDGLRLPR